jgi:SAM-dependent methyltransferase
VGVSFRRRIPALGVAKMEALGLWSALHGAECPFCRNRLRFRVVNTQSGKSETLCMRCRSLERQRRVVLFLRRETNLYRDHLKVLHVAPEHCIRHELEKLANLECVSGDINLREGDLRIDVTDIPAPDETFDVILCSHVLEHVPDDRKALREFRRVLKPNGWALINVPSDPSRSEIYEDDSIVDPQGRRDHFGQEDHVRVYSVEGFLSRVRGAGLVPELDPVEFTPREKRRYLLYGDRDWDHMYFCRRGPPAQR